MKKYDHKKIEKKWQKNWAKQDLFKTEENSEKPKSYVLDMFPYPSGDGLHVGHPKGYIATDIYSRYKKMNGFNVLHPMGWDAFGLPAENYAIKNKVHPRKAVEKNIKRYKEQLSIIGFNYDWEREINTTDPEYYKFTQWIFLEMYKKGLAYESHEPINWCPSCQTGLANEDLEDGKCERCGSVVEKKPIRQWVLKITDYADKLIEGLNILDWPESIKESQRNWIGRSEGALVEFKIKDTELGIKVFTTRADTLFGVTYVVLAPENNVVLNLKNKISNWSDVLRYIEEAKNKTQIERTAEGKEKTGVELKGIKAINPANNEEVSVWIADYVLADYGTGAVMAVPAHDERDFEFAKKYNLPIKKVILGGKDGVFVGEGVLVNSQDFDGLTSDRAREKIIQKFGERKVNYKLRDWVFSRQRYWGEPIPLIHCEKCGVVPVPETDLPVKLPNVKKYEPTGTGESPLADIAKWVNVKCPACGENARRETNTMPQWAGSCWYYIAYCISKNLKSQISISKQIEDVDFKNKISYWNPVDMYVGGAEHATRHLIYARFWHKFLFDIGVVSTTEPFIRLKHVGLIQAQDGRKMSKRYGNVINPDDIVKTWGADTLRIYEMFMGPFANSIAWNTDSMIGSRRFLEKVWRLKDRIKNEQLKTNDKNENLEIIFNKTIKKVGEDIENFNFNTAISSMMIFVNELEKQESISRELFETVLKLISPFAPHISEELWFLLGHDKSIYFEKWPNYDEQKIVSTTTTIIIQIGGKIRASVSFSKGLGEKQIRDTVESMAEVKKWLNNKTIKRVVFVPDRLINFVID